MTSSVISDNFETSTGAIPTLGGDSVETRLCRAWVNFNGTGAVAIRGSYNVSSITDGGTGDYTVNITNAMSDINYVPVASHSGLGAAGASPSGNRMIGVSIISTTAVELACRSISNILEDYPQLFVAIFK